jgi:hypothetical protein
MSDSIHKALLDVVKQKRDDLKAAETALQDHADDIVKAKSPFKVGEAIADRRVQTKPFAIIEKVYCPYPELLHNTSEPRIMIRKIRADGEPSLNIQQLRDPSLYVKFKPATPIEDDEL